MRKIAPFADTQIVLSEGQLSALHAYDYAQSARDDEALRQTKYHLDAWDRHFGRESTLTLRERRNTALRQWAGWIFVDGAGI